MTDSHEIAKRYAGSRPGLELVGFEEVGVPFYRLRLQALVQREKPLGPIDEFTLEAVSLGINKVADVTGVLGLDAVVVEQAIVDLCNRDLLDYRHVPNGLNLVLTQMGKKSLEECLEIVPDRVEISVAFDRLTWSVSPQIERSLIRPRDARDQGMIELPPKMQRRLRPDDLDVHQVEQALKSRQHSFLESATIVSIKDVTCYRMFEPAVALVFVDSANGEQQVALAIDGRVSERAETALSEIDGAKRVRLIVDASASVTERRPTLPPEIRRQQAEKSEIRALAVQEAEANKEIESARILSSGAQSNAERAKAENAHEMAIESRDAAREKVNEHRIRPLETFEHRVVLRDALKDTTQRLLIISPWVRGDVVDQQFVDSIERLAKRGVAIHIGWGISRGRQDDQDQYAISRLSRLASEYKNVVLKNFGNTHAKILITDDRLVVTSFNWLSFRGTERRSYRQEVGTLIAERQYVQTEYEKHVGQFT